MRKRLARSSRARAGEGGGGSLEGALASRVAASPTIEGEQADPTVVAHQASKVLQRVVGAGVVDHVEVPVLVGLGLDGAHRLGGEVRPVAGGDDDVHAMSRSTHEMMVEARSRPIASRTPPKGDRWPRS